MMENALSPIFATVIGGLAVGGLAGGIAGGLVAWIGNYFQSWIDRRIRDIDELKRNFYNYLNLSVKYWIGEEESEANRRALEAQMIALERIISTDYSLLAKRYGKVQTSYNATKKFRVELWDAAMGGCFHQKENWKADIQRARQVASDVTQIVKSLY